MSCSITVCCLTEHGCRANKRGRTGAEGFASRIAESTDAHVNATSGSAEEANTGPSGADDGEEGRGEVEGK